MVAVVNVMVVVVEVVVVAVVVLVTIAIINTTIDAMGDIITSIICFIARSQKIEVKNLICIKIDPFLIESM